MKKLLTAVLSVLICFSARSAISAKSVEPVDKSGQISNNGYTFEIDYEDEKGRVVYGPNGIDIFCENRQIHLDTTFEVRKLISIGDINNDGYTDFFAYENASEFTDQLFTIDGHSGAVIASVSYTHKYNSESLGEIQENSYILKMAAKDQNVVLIVDYSLIIVDPITGTELVRYSAEDNIWDFEIFENYIVVSDQKGNATILDNDLNVVYTKKIAQSYDVPYAYADEWGYIERIKAEMSAFDVWQDEYEPDVAYVTTQDGYLWRFDLNTITEEMGTVTLIRMLDEEEYEKNLGYEYETTATIDKVSYGITNAAGLFSSEYMNYKVVDSNEKYLLIACGVGDEEKLQSESSDWTLDYYGGSSMPDINFVIYNRETGVSIMFSPAELSNSIDAILVDYNDTEALMIISISEGEAHLFISDFEGNILYQKTLKMSVATGNKQIRVSALEDGYLIEALEEGIVRLNSKLDTLTELFVKSSSEMVESDAEGYTLAFAENKVKTKLEHYDNAGNVVWSYALPDDGNYRGMEGLLIGDFNKDGTEDYIFAAINYDKQDQPTWARYIVVNGKDGTAMRNGTIEEYDYYDENWKKVIVWVNSSEIKMVEDWDKDGCRELIIGNCTVSSKNFACKGYVTVDIYDDGIYREIGDANGDGVEDYLFFASNNKLATMYCSSVSNYNVVYYRQDKTITLNTKGDNLNYALVLGDINDDGAKEILINNYNSKNYQVIDVYDGKTLNKLYTLFEDGVSDYEILVVSDMDINEDGYKELIGTTGSYWCGELFDGKTGKLMFYFPFYENETIDTEYEYYHPDYLISIMNDETALQLVLTDAGDINGDGIHDLMYTASEYDYSSGESGNVLVLRSGADYELIEKIVLPSASESSSGTLSTVRNSDEILAIKFSDSTSLVTKSGELIADYKLKADEFIYIDEKTVLAIAESSVYRLNIEDSFTLTSEIPEEMNDNQLTLSWKPLVDYSVMKIYDNGNLVYYGSQTETTVSLLQGDHKITLSLCDGDGKSSNAAYKVTVNPQSNSYIWMAGLAVVMIGAAIAVALYREIYIRKHNVTTQVVKEGE